MRTLCLSLLLLACLAGCGQQKQTVATQEAPREWVTNRSFTFIPEFLYPMTGGRRYISGGSYLRISKDSIHSDLPFFGEAYTIGYGQGGGFRFQSSDFKYSQAQGRKGRMEITMEPRDVPGVSKLFLTVFANGKASLQIVSTNRSAISYDGSIRNTDLKEN